MKTFRRLGVYLDEWPDDADVLAYTGRIATLAESEIIHCVFWARHGKDAKGNTIDHEAFVREHLPAELANRITVEIREHGAAERILQASREQDFDLILAGRSLPSSQLAVGNEFNRIVRKAPCSVLLVPAEARVHLARILVPVDFSDHSRMALETALDVARASGESNPQVVVQTVFCVGYGHLLTGLTLEEACQQLEKVSRKQLEEFVQGIDTSGVDFELECTCSEEPEAVVHELAKARKMDMICVGSRGSKSPAVALLGGTAERIIVRSSAPILVVKQKGETARFLDVLLDRA